MAEASAASANPLADVLPDDELENPDELSECDCCGLMKPDCELVNSYMGETFACGDCRDYDPFLEYKTRVYRGVED